MPARPNEERVVRVSEMSAGKCEGESGGGKRPYEPPRVLGLSPVDEGRGLRNCSPGSGDGFGCYTGNVARTGCGSGNMFTM